MSIDEIKLEINVLAKEHHSTDEIVFIEIIEAEAIRLIVSYCEHYGYNINGFPTEKRKLFENQDNIEGEDEEEYFCYERFQLYLDSLALLKDDVAELLWFYNTSFWPEHFETKESFLKNTKDLLEDGFYDIEL